jgi:hypothetical protein
MPKQLSKEQLEENANTISQILESFGSRKYAPAAATRALSHNLILTNVKSRLKERVSGKEEEFKKELGFNPYFSEAIGDYGRYDLAILTTAITLADTDGTPLSLLTKGALYIIDDYVPNLYRTNGTMDTPFRPVDVLDSRPNYSFRKKLEKLLRTAHQDGYVIFDEKREMVYREAVDPVKMTVEFWKRKLGFSIGKSSLKRSICSVKASLHAPILREMPNLIIENHLGEEIGFRKKDAERWYMLTGPNGAGLAFTDPSLRVHLQYEKSMFGDVDWTEKQSEAYSNITTAIEFCPFMERTHIARLFPTDYETFIEITSKNETLAPAKIGKGYVSKPLAKRLNWGSKEPLGLEQHNARVVLQKLWGYLLPPRDKEESQKTLERIEQASNVALTALTDLKNGRDFMAKSPMELAAMKALSPYVEMSSSGGYQTKKGMEDSIAFYALFAGVW